MKKLLVMLALVLIAQTATAEMLTCVVPSTQYCNVRKAPRSDAATWGRLHNGDTVRQTGGVENGFVQVEFEGRKAYVSVRCVEESGTGTFVVDANGRVAKRKSPNGERKAWIQPGASVEVVAFRFDSSGGKWARLSDGYIKSDYLR